MTETRSTSPRLLARLPSGDILSPSGAADETVTIVCAGPDADGYCPVLLRGGPRACAGAEWFYSEPRPGHGARFDALGSNALCPAAVLDPTGSFADGPGAIPDPSA